jgi:hypothetical protein
MKIIIITILSCVEFFQHFWTKKIIENINKKYQRAND